MWVLRAPHNRAIRPHTYGGERQAIGRLLFVAERRKICLGQWAAGCGQKKAAYPREDAALCMYLAKLLRRKSSRTSHNTHPLGRTDAETPKGRVYRKPKTQISAPRNIFGSLPSDSSCRQPRRRHPSIAEPGVHVKNQAGPFSGSSDFMGDIAYQIHRILPTSGVGTGPSWSSAGK